MSNKPTHSAYQVREYEADGQKKSYWTKIGSVWEHKDGAGYNVRLTAFPVDGNLVIRPVKERNDEDADAVDA